MSDPSPNGNHAAPAPAEGHNPTFDRGGGKPPVARFSELHPEGRAPACVLAHRQPITAAACEGDRIELISDFLLSRTLRPEPDIRDRDGDEYKAHFERMVADILERGVQQPVQGFRDGEFARIWDGWTRCQASLMAGKTTVPLLLHSRRPEGQERVLGSLQANAMRLDMEDFEYAAVYQQLLVEFGWTQAELASRLHVSASLVSKRMRLFSGIPQDIRGLFGRGPGKLGGRAAYAISSPHLDDESKRELARLAIDRDLKVQALEAIIKDRAGKKQKSGKPFKATVCGWSLTTREPEEKRLPKLRELRAKVDEVIKAVEKDPRLARMLPELLAG